MEPLDLRFTAPRHPRQRLRGLALLPRTIDKARALLPGGEPGEYFISPGFSAFILGKIGISEHDFVALVAAARDDDDVADKVLGGIDPERIARWSAMVENLRVDQIGPDLRATFDGLYGVQAPDALVLDVLAGDDAAIAARR